MSTPSASPPAPQLGSSAAAPPVVREGGPGPVAVVWCRQVDNEAESPGYTTIPEDFPGRRETLDLIRLVGNLTVNVADTHDYWMPGPPAPLNYYPNLFLYPAYGGRYTCVGRMFLSTEDRPRLGMKTLVLDSSQLLASGEYGPNVLRWHATMAGGRSDGRKPPVPDPNLYALLGEGLLFFRGSTEPVVTVASAGWDAAMEVIFDLVRVLPASLLQLGAILAFPYFLPQAKTNLHEFSEQVPLALALMRIPSAEAAGDRHRKRIQSWESTNVTFRDLTEGVPAPGGRAKDGVPLVLQYVRDHNATRLGPIVQRVDLVELPKLKNILSDSERGSGKERRKEMWRIGTAMESAALLLQRSRGRHVPVSVETARRAQEYIKAKLPEPAPAPGEAAPTAPAAEAAAAGAGHPGWLTKSADLPPVARGGREVVPLPVSDDPSLRSGRAAPARPAAPPAGEATGAAPVAPPAETPLAREVEAVLARVLDGRLSQVEEELLRRLANEIEQAVGVEVDRRVDAAAESKFRAILQSSETKLAQALTNLDTRWQDKLENLSPIGGATAAVEWRQALDQSIEQKVRAAGEAEAARLEEALARIERRLADADLRAREASAQFTDQIARGLSEGTRPLEGRLTTSEAVAQELAEAQRALMGRLESVEVRHAQLEEGSATLSTQLAAASATAAALAARLDELPGRVAETEAHQRELTELATALKSQIEELGRRAEEGPQRLTEALARLSSETTRTVQSRISESETRAAQQLTGLLASTETRLRESMPATLAAEIDRRLKVALDRELADDPGGARGLLAERIDSRTDELVRLEVGGAREQFERSLNELEERVQERLKTAQSASAPLTGRALESVQPLLERRLGEIIEVQRRALEDLRAQVLQREDAERAALSATIDRQLSELSGQLEDARAQSELALREGAELRASEVRQQAGRELRELESRLSSLLETRSKETAQKLQKMSTELEGRAAPVGEERFTQLDGKLTRQIDEKVEALKEAQAHSEADLQVRLQSYSDQRLRETEERVRTMSVELVARQRGEVESALARLPDPAKLESQLKERIQRAGETLRGELLLALDQRVGQAEDRLHQGNLGAIAKLDTMESDARNHAKELVKIEESLRTELEEVDRRLVTLADRLLPVVRKTWLRVAELEKNPPAAAVDLEPRFGQLRRELKDELRKVDLEMADRSRELRDRMETTIAHQGKVWLTLIHQLSQLTDQRRSSESVPYPPLAAGPVSDPEEDDGAVEEEPVEEPPSRRRMRRSARGL